MEYNYYVYEKGEADLQLTRMPIWFKEVEFNGDKTKGNLILHSQNDYDEIWGANAKMDISWETRDRQNFYYGREVQASINTYNSIGLVITSKENSWLQSHEITTWFGQRSKILQKRFYSEKSIHAIFFCDITERLINIHTAIIDKYYENFKPLLLKAYSSIVCHSI
jgi:hypothetical protein